MDQQVFKPTLVFETITFSDDTTLTFDESEIVVFVGPNNAGKSASLRELENLVARNSEGKIIKSATFKKHGNADDLRNYLEKNSLKSGDAHNLTYGGIGYGIHHSHVVYFDQQTDRHPVASFLAKRLATETRITAANAAGAISLFREPPTHPIHLLLMDENLSERINALFKHAFGKDLVPFHGGGKNLPLLVGERPALAHGEHFLSRGYIDRLLAQTEQLDLQGDGMRSFATVLLYVLASDTHSIQFLDEPEAFLHPPQARLLGEFIAKHRPPNSQLFIATHSTDMLDGLMQGNSDKVRVVRIQREGNINNIKELSSERAASIARDTLARYSGVFSGIFYQHVIICESDADCLFYSSILNTNSVSGDRRADVLFIHAAGKHRMAKLASTLRSLGVPVSVIADIDLLNEEHALKTLLTTLGGAWADISADWKALKQAIEERRPPLSAEQVKGMIEVQLKEVQGGGPFPKASERAIKNVFRSLSCWDEIKRGGRSSLPAGQATKQYNAISDVCAKYGLWLVNVGELEGFCKSVEASHGPAFVEKVLEERDLEADEELEEARRFVSAIWKRARPQ